MTISAIIGNKGDPIGVPNVCLYICLNVDRVVKNVDVKTNLIAVRNSFCYKFMFLLIWSLLDIVNGQIQVYIGE